MFGLDIYAYMYRENEVQSLDMDGNLCSWSWNTDNSSALTYTAQYPNVSSKDCGELNGASVASMTPIPAISASTSISAAQSYTLVPGNVNRVQCISTKNAVPQVLELGKIGTVLVVQSIEVAQKEQGLNWCVVGTDTGGVYLIAFHIQFPNNTTSDVNHSVNADLEYPKLHAVIEREVVAPDKQQPCLITDMMLVKKCVAKDHEEVEVGYVTEMGLYASVNVQCRPRREEQQKPGQYKQGVNATDTNTSTPVHLEKNSSSATDKTSSSTNISPFLDAATAEVMAELSDPDVDKEEENPFSQLQDDDEEEEQGIDITHSDHESDEDEDGTLQGDNPFATSSTATSNALATYTSYKPQRITPLYLTRTPLNSRTSHHILHWTDYGTITRLTLAPDADDYDEDHGYVYEVHPMNKLGTAAVKFVDTVKYDIAYGCEYGSVYATLLPTSNEEEDTSINHKGGLVLYKPHSNTSSNVQGNTWSTTLPAREHTVFCSASIHGTCIVTNHQYLRCYTRTGIPFHIEQVPEVYTMFSRGNVLVLVLQDGTFRIYKFQAELGAFVLSNSLSTIRVPVSANGIQDVTWCGISTNGNICVMLHHVQLLMFCGTRFIPVLNLRFGKYDWVRNQDTLRYYPIALCCDAPPSMDNSDETQNAQKNVLSMRVLGVALYHGEKTPELRQGRLPVTTSLSCTLPFLSHNILEQTYVWKMMVREGNEEEDEVGAELDRVLLRMLHGVLSNTTTSSSSGSKRARVYDMASRLSTLQGMQLGMQLCRSLGEEGVCQLLAKRIELYEEQMLQDSDDDDEEEVTDCYEGVYQPGSRRQVTPDEQRGVLNNNSVEFEQEEENDEDVMPTQLNDTSDDDDNRSALSPPTPSSPVRKRRNNDTTTDNTFDLRKRTRSINPFQKRRQSSESTMQTSGSNNLSSKTLSKHAFASPSPTKRLSRKSTFGRKSLEMSQRGRHII